jgi:hypothetical protein
MSTALTPAIGLLGSIPKYCCIKPTIIVEEDDKVVNPLDVKGMGELGMVGIPAAIARSFRLG